MTANEVKAGHVIEGGCIMIVDDDPVVAGMLGVSLEVDGHRVIEVNSGEEALTMIAAMTKDDLPDVFFLDINLGAGIDGYEICRRLRDIDAAKELPVIFLSGHDGLDDRLKAYDAGGSDFVAKPFNPDEVLRKANIAIRHKRRQAGLASEGQASFATAMTAISSLGESGIAMTFTRGALGCRTLNSLAKLTIESMRSFGIDCHVQLRVPTGRLTLTPEGHASPLEESVIEQSQSMGRIFSFRNRAIINYDRVSLLLLNMPVSDEELCGRIRDHAAMIAEAAELAADNIDLRNEAFNRAEELRQLATDSSEAVETLRCSFRDIQIATRLELETMIQSIEGMYVHLGLTGSQEFNVSDTVRSAVNNVLKLLEKTRTLDENFTHIVEHLTSASTYVVAQEDDAPVGVELW